MGRFSCQQVLCLEVKGDINESVVELTRVLTGGEVVVVKSTVPVGTAERIQSLFDNDFNANSRIFKAICPEFLREGTSVKDFLEPSRIVIYIAGCQNF